jgi:AcrR family transcriptional regulator
MIGELFREYGYHGTSYGQITEATGLGKGSLYNYFPDGKEGMTRAVLAHVHDWFEGHVFAPLEGDGDPREAVLAMFAEVDAYFRSGKRICLLGAFSLYDARDAFDREIATYFTRWVAALKTCLKRGGVPRDKAGMLAMASMVEIQGGLVMAQALSRPGVFKDALARSCHTLEAALDAEA